MPDSNIVDATNVVPSFASSLFNQDKPKYKSLNNDELLKELKEIKELISPKPSIILTGQRVIDEYYKLTK